MCDVDINKPVTDIVDLPFQKARRVCQRASTDKHKLKEGPSTLFGINIPGNVKEALELNKKNGNQKWADMIHKEMQGLHEHKTYHFLAPGQRAPRNYQFTPVCLIFTVKPDL